MLKHAWAGLSASLAISLVAAAPALAGETISFSFGTLIRSLKISSLKTFADTGSVPEDLAYFLQFSSPKQQGEFRKALVEKAPIDPLTLSRFFNSAMG
jgi:hypothetical protein